MQLEKGSLEKKASLKKSIPEKKTATTNIPDVKTVKTSIHDDTASTTNIPDVKAATTSIPDVKAAIPNSPDVTTTPTNIPDVKTATTNISDSKASTTSIPDVKATTPKTHDVKATTPKTLDVNEATLKTPDVRAATTKAPDVKTASTKTPDDKAATRKIPDASTATTKTHDVKTTAPKIPDVKPDATAGPPSSTSTSITESDCEVTFVGSTNVGAPENSRFLLGEQDIRIITSGEWLTDHIIGAAHSVLLSQFPYAKGLENTTLGPVYNFSIQEGKFAQILHTGSHHWILVSNIGCSSQSEVKLYDSLFRGRISIFIKKKVASFLHEESRSFKIIVPGVQRQNNYDDCGIFAIAFLVSLLHGLNPSDLTFDSAAMRRHLLNSLNLHGLFLPLPPL